VEAEATAVEMMGILAEIRRRYQESPTLPLLRLGEVAPSQVSVVVTNSKSMKQAPFLMKWGYSQNRGGLIINARSESITEKPMFKESVHSRRCMIPANRYFEWQASEGHKQKYSLFPEDHAFFFMAGIYRPEGPDGLPSFVILTREAPEVIRQIHPRMPVILPRDQWNEWLNPIVDPRLVIETAITQMAYEQVAP
jgi:putative SOS response-associated peptidase YedK